MILLPSISGIHPDTEQLLVFELEQRSAESGNQFLCELLVFASLNLALAHGPRAMAEALYGVADQIATTGQPV
jgi:hypothetical protein